MSNIFDAASDMFEKGTRTASDVFEKSTRTASDLLEKGKDATRTIADSAGDLANRGRIKAKLYDQGLEYDRLMKRLGDALYDELKNDPKYVDTNQSLFKEIEACLAKKQQLEDELAAAQTAEDKPIDVTPVEPDTSEEPKAEEEDAQ